MSELETIVHTRNACALPGCTLKVDFIIPCLRRAVGRGFVRADHASFIEGGLRDGFDLGVDDSKMRGRRVFRNAPSAFSDAAMDALADSVCSRVARGKTVDLGLWEVVSRELDGYFGPDYCVFPLGCVPKPHNPSVLRPTSNHTRSNLNNSIFPRFLAFLQHTLQVERELSGDLAAFYYLAVSRSKKKGSSLPRVRPQPRTTCK